MGKGGGQLPQPVLYVKLWALVVLCYRIGVDHQALFGGRRGFLQSPFLVVCMFLA